MLTDQIYFSNFRPSVPALPDRPATPATNAVNLLASKTTIASSESLASLTSVSTYVRSAAFVETTLNVRWSITLLSVPVKQVLQGNRPSDVRRCSNVVDPMIVQTT